MEKDEIEDELSLNEDGDDDLDEFLNEFDD